MKIATFIFVFVFVFVFRPLSSATGELAINCGKSVLDFEPNSLVIEPTQNMQQGV